MCVDYYFDVDWVATLFEWIDRVEKNFCYWLSYKKCVNLFCAIGPTDKFVSQTTENDHIPIEDCVTCRKYKQHVVWRIHWGSIIDRIFCSHEFKDINQIRDGLMCHCRLPNRSIDILLFIYMDWRPPIARSNLKFNLEFSMPSVYVRILWIFLSFFYVKSKLIFSKDSL